MIESGGEDYILTIVQHTYCGDCIWVKGKITDVYHASGIVRGEDSKRWRVQIVSPPWDREARMADFPTGFETVDVPAMKLELGKRLLFATQHPTMISDLLVKLKWLLINRHSNAQIEGEIKQFVHEWNEKPSTEACAVSQ